MQENRLSSSQNSAQGLAIQTLKSLPVFEVADPSGMPAFVALSQRQNLHLVPPQAPTRGLLTGDCLLAGSSVERGVMTHVLGVREMTLTEWYR